VKGKKRGKEVIKEEEEGTGKLHSLGSEASSYQPLVKEVRHEDN